MRLLFNHKMTASSILITGVSRGIGLELVKQFVALPQPPKFVFATCRKPEEADDLQAIAKDNSNVNILKLEMTDYKAYPAIHQEIKKKVGDSGLNLLINNAAVCSRATLEDVTQELMMENFEVNVVCPLLFTKELLPLLKTAASKGDQSNLSCSRAGIVNFSSRMGSIDDNTSGGIYPYRTSKAAINMVTRSLSVDLKPEGILAFVIHPGWVITAMGGEGAEMTTEMSARGVIDTIFKATEVQCGAFLNYNGGTLTW